MSNDNLRVLCGHDSMVTLSPALRDTEGGTRETKARHPRSQYPFSSERASHFKKKHMIKAKLSKSVFLKWEN